MSKAINLIKYIMLFCVIVMLSLIIYGFYTVPDEIYTVENRSVQIKEIYSLKPLEVSKNDIKNITKEGKYEVNVKLLGTLPIKTMNMTVGKRQYVVPSGRIFGLRLFTNGVVIVSTGEVRTENGTVDPAKQAGLAAGDAITEINGEKVSSSSRVSEIFSSYSGEPYDIKYIRNGKEYVTKFRLYFSVSDNKYLAGLWIKDSAAGIGTMTYYDKTTGAYAGLGHGVYDTQSNKILPLFGGDIVDAKVNGCYKGKNGQAGELCGVFTSDTCGSLCMNCEKGVYGFLTATPRNGEELPVALGDEVKEGSAEIICTTDESGPKRYSVQIEKINRNDGQYRNLVIRITDENLINKTGGIVQGMSGSPIIQNGMLVGAVTHVFINEPLCGYGIFAESMLETTNRIVDETLDKAS